MENVTIRAEVPEDRAAVWRVNKLAFGQAGEADLVDALRDVGAAAVSLVAVEGNQVIGHILFSPVAVEGGDGPAALGLAPMAVLPERQRRGVGSLLVRQGLEACRRLGAGLVVVVGHPEYYPRFGFVPAKAHGLRCEYPVPDEVFMVRELRPGALDGLAGLVKYRPEFAKL
jgi:putative acetyltransferase